MQFGFSLNGPAALFVIMVLIFILAMIPIVPGLIISALVRRRVEAILRQHAGTVIVEYDPPHGLSPAEIGLLYDTTCDDKEIRATLFELARKHTIEMTSENSVTIIDQAALDQLPEYARIAVDIHTGKRSSQTKGAFTRAVRESLQTKGIAVRSYYRGFWLRVLLVMTILLLLLWLGTAATGIDSNGTHYAAWTLEAIGIGALWALSIGFFAFPVLLLASFFGILIFVKIAGRAWINTRQVRAIWPELEGYRRFLVETDLSRIQFESEDRSHNPVTDTLPYAMVFNLETKWRDRLRGN